MKNIVKIACLFVLLFSGIAYATSDADFESQLQQSLAKLGFKCLVKLIPSDDHKGKKNLAILYQSGSVSMDLLRLVSIAAIGAKQQIRIKVAEKTDPKRSVTLFDAASCGVIPLSSFST